MIYPMNRDRRQQSAYRVRVAASSSPSRLAQVATRAYPANYGYNPGNTALMCRTAHIARDAITSFQVVYANWYVDTNNNTNTWAELGTGSTASLKVGFETAAGAFSQFQFSGTATGSVASGATIVSDPLTVNLAAGDKFYLRPLFSNTGGILYTPAKADAGFGDRFEFTATDKTVSGTISNGLAGYAYFPVAIIAQTKKRSAFLLGTSRTFGFNDTADGTTGDIGLLARAVGPNWAYGNAGVPGSSLQTTAPNFAKRAAIANAYYTDTIIEHGVNDNGRTQPQRVTDLATIMDLITNRKRLVTVAPSTTGAWTAADGSDQTNNNAYIQATWNPYLLTLPNGAYACHDIAPVHTQANGKWKAPGYTDDGLHPIQAANLLVRDSGLITI